MTVLQKLRKSLARGGEAVRRVIGAPDYERYLAHARASHPDQVPLGPAEFMRNQFQNRYSRPGSRCC